MKKIYYLLVVVVLGFTACQKQPNLAPTSYVTSMNLTLAASDYQLLPSADYPSKTLSFNSYADANTFIPTILGLRDPQLGNGSTANVTFSLATPSIKVPDSLSSQSSYTVTSADYFAVTGNHYGDFEASDVLNFLVYKYPTPTPNQLAVLTYVLYTGSDNTVTNSFLYVNGGWIKIYQVSNAQYAVAGEGKYDQFSAGDLPHLVSYFNYFLKNDATIADTAQAKDIEYISYSYYASGNYQKVMALTYDGSNWGMITTQATLPFIKNAGAWGSNAAIYYTLTTADTKLIAASNVAPASLLSNLGSYGDFETSWTTAELDAAFILVLSTDFPTPKPNINYVVTYLLYTGGTDVPTQLTFQYNGSAWVAK
jgi:hypothetical protein